ncbi:hypothetical protein GIB67_000366 [Kingdonia uniflora]|uniref:Telomere repeat-binding protein 1-6-like ubiquitin-like domain-containing protein n=1 Tax=Kingdonia uniflora TaxID=39325 RepID=A0A7J7LKI9_9MAGN|nr:hypothetical protein GIB67_000366 [Kingdonia uniflora]
MVISLGFICWGLFVVINKFDFDFDFADALGLGIDFCHYRLPRKDEETTIKRIVRISEEKLVLREWTVLTNVPDIIISTLTLLSDPLPVEIILKSMQMPFGICYLQLVIGDGIGVEGLVGYFYPFFFLPLRGILLASFRIFTWPPTSLNWYLENLFYNVKDLASNEMLNINRTRLPKLSIEIPETTTFAVKLRIKSFRVPELIIEIPKTATVAFLKRTVAEAVTTMLGGGLQVGIVLQGEQVRDENGTLLLTGILHDNKLDSLGFTLQPKPYSSSPLLCDEDPSFLVHRSTPQPLIRYLTTPLDQGPSDAFLNPPVIRVGNLVEGGHDSKIY